MNAHSNVALTLAHLRHAFDALKRSATALLARPHAPYTSTTPSITACAHSDAPEVVDSEPMSAPQLSGAAIVASVGLRYSPFTRSVLLPRILLHPAVGPSNIPSSLLATPLEDLDILIKLPPTLDNETPHSATSSLGTHESMVCTRSEPTLLSPSMASTSYASSSSGSASSFECATPPIATVDITNSPEPRVRSFGSVSSTHDVRARSTWLDVHGALDALEANVPKLLQQSEEPTQIQYKPQPNGHEMDAAPEWESYEVDEVRPNNEPESGSPQVDEGASEDIETDDEPEDADEPRPRTVLHNPHTESVYTVEGVVADGGFSRVVQVVDVAGRRCAAKIVHKQAVCKRADARDSLLREKAFMVRAAEMDTRRLVGLIESWEDEENVYFIMELFPCSLQDLLCPRDGSEKPELTEHDKRLLCAEMLSSLSVLHANGIVHRDIKPANFLLSAARGAVQADFGLALEAGLDSTITGTCGTEDYLAPEQWWAPAYDSRVDIWQLGCTFIELLAGLDGPWLATFREGVNPLRQRGWTRSRVQNRLRHSVKRLLPGHPALKLLLKMVHIDPKERPTAEQIRDDPWFEGINWDDIIYGPTAPRSFRPRPVELDTKSSPLHSTFDRLNTPSLASKHSKDGDAERAAENLAAQMAMFGIEPLAFVYPLPASYVDIA